jgi:uncharacterized protein (DUF983 family)
MTRWVLRIVGIVMLLLSLFMLQRMQKMLLDLQQARESAPAR